MKKIISFFLVLTLSVALCSCGNNNGDTDETTEKEYKVPTPVVSSDISIPYIGTEKLDPYTSKSEVNIDVFSAVFEGLYEATTDCKGAPVLAETGKNDGNKVTVTLKKGVLFSDGTPLTAKQVESSFYKAKNSSRYSAQLENIIDFSYNDNYTLVFTLSYPDSFALNTLDFPIVSGESGKYNGTGKYIISYLDGKPYLEINKKCRNYKKDAREQIALYDMAGVSSPVYPFKANEISVYKNTLSDGKYSNLSSKTVSVPTNNFVYAGLNMNWAGSVLSMEFVRKAINIGIDRTAVAASSFLGQCSATATPFRSECYKLKGVEVCELDGNLERAIKLLEDNGYKKINKSGVRTNGSSALNVSVLVCGNNQYKVDVAESLKETLKTLGFGVTVEKLGKKEYLSALKDGYFDIYIGETVLTKNYDLSEFFSSNGALNYGIDSDFYEFYNSFYKGNISLQKFVEAFYSEVPFIPLFYRKSVVSVNPNIDGVTNSEILYKNIDSWKSGKK